MTPDATMERRRRVARMFARIAPVYDRMNTLMTLGLHRRWRRALALEALSAPSGPALDVASGTGDLSLALVEADPYRRVVALDIAPPMLERLRAKVEARGLGGRVLPVRGDALHLPFPDGTFSLVASAFCLRNLPRLVEGLREMVRVLRPGGLLLSLEAFPPAGGPLSTLVRLHLGRVVPLLGALVARDLPAYTYLGRSVEEFRAPKEVSEVLRGLGLEAVSFRRLGLGSVALHRAVKPYRP